MADEEEDKGWMQKQPRSPTSRTFHSPWPSNFHTQEQTDKAFKTEKVVVDSAKTSEAIAVYKQKFPSAAYATEMISMSENKDGTVTITFERYPSAD